MKCDVCGITLQDDYVYCPSCGNNLEEQKVDTIINGNKQISVLRILLITIMIVILVISFYYLGIGINSDLTIVGNWKCADYDNNISIDDESIYYFNMYFNKDGIFSQDSLSNSKTSFSISGTYNEKISSSNMIDDSYRGYLDVYMTTNKVIRNGVSEDVNSTNHYDFRIHKSNNSAIVINSQSYSVYLCKRY